MDIARAGTAAPHQAPFPGGPLIELLLTGEGDGPGLAVAHAVIPPGGGCPSTTMALPPRS